MDPLSKQRRRRFVLDNLKVVEDYFGPRVSRSSVIISPVDLSDNSAPEEQVRFKAHHAPGLWITGENVVLVPEP